MRPSPLAVALPVNPGLRPWTSPACNHAVLAGKSAGNSCFRAARSARTDMPYIIEYQYISCGTEPGNLHADGAFAEVLPPENALWRRRRQVFLDFKENNQILIYMVVWYASRRRSGGRQPRFNRYGR